MNCGQFVLAVWRFCGLGWSASWFRASHAPPLVPLVPPSPPCVVLGQRVGPLGSKCPCGFGGVRGFMEIARINGTISGANDRVLVGGRELLEDRGNEEPFEDVGGWGREGIM